MKPLLQGTLVAAAALASVACRGCVPCYLTHQSDAVLIANFEAHRSDFERMVQLSRTARSFVIGTAKSNPPALVPAGVTSELLSALAQARVQEVSGGGGLDTTRFFCSDCGGVMAGNGKGYLQSDAELAPVLNTLDGFRPKKAGTVFRAIGKGWYLYYEAW